MAETRLHLVPFPAPGRKPKTQPLPEAKQIAKETLAIVNQCAQALHGYQAETEATLAHICGLLDSLEVIAIRTLALNHLDEHRHKPEVTR